MRRSGAKGVTAADRGKKGMLCPPVERASVGMPALDSVTGVDRIVKGRKVLRIIHTNEVDAYERPPPSLRAKTR